MICLTAMAACAFAVYRLSRKRKIPRRTAAAAPLLAGYLTFIVTATLIDRNLKPAAYYELELFWTYRAIAAGETELIGELIPNILLFVPAGFLAAALLRRRRWIVPPAGMLFSAAIEGLQLLIRRGYFELDDIFHNTLGVCLGLIVFLLFSPLFRAIYDRAKRLAAARRQSRNNQ